jgi:hypothetical protein
MIVPKEYKEEIQKELLRFDAWMRNMNSIHYSNNKSIDLAYARIIESKLKTNKQNEYTTRKV